MDVDHQANLRRCREAQPKVDFLRDPAAYPDRPARVELRATHMAWVFLTDRRVYKMKKPVRYEWLDFATLAGRRRDCEAEVRLNRRLAPGVYHGLVPLTEAPGGGLRLGRAGEPVDWLVEMRRLPEQRFLERMIERGAVEADDVEPVGRLLARFYERAQRVSVTPPRYRALLAESVRENQRVVSDERYGCPPALVRRLAEALLEVIELQPALFDRRVLAGRVVDAHGDLRPEHICLEDPPKIIDCLEFSHTLRQLDAASELSFLHLETQRLGAEWVGRSVLETYVQQTGDEVDQTLLRFYRGYHALARAKVAARHLDDPTMDHHAKWQSKAREYLELVEPVVGQGLVG